MRSHFHKTIEHFRGIAMLLLLIFVLQILYEFITVPILIPCALVAIVLGLWLAQKTAHHFHTDHHHTMDSPFDGVGVFVLFLVNVLHPALDGFSGYQAFVLEGRIAGIVVSSSMILHELVRQSALVALFTTMHIRWYWVVLTALLGIGLGIGAGVVGATFLDRFEYIIDLVTLFAYSFIIAEFYFAYKKGHK